MFCTNCGKPTPPGAKFCQHCGAAQPAPPPEPTNQKLSFEGIKEAAQRLIVQEMVQLLETPDNGFNVPDSKRVGEFVLARIDTINTPEQLAAMMVELTKMYPDYLMTAAQVNYLIRTNE